MSEILTLVRSVTGQRTHWADRHGRSLCGRLSSATITPGTRDDLCSRCAGAMRRLSWGDEVEALVMDVRRTIARAYCGVPSGVVLSWEQIDLAVAEREAKNEEALDRRSQSVSVDTTSRGGLLAMGKCVGLTETQLLADTEDLRTLVRDALDKRTTTVEIHTAGELHPAPEIPSRVTFTYNLSDLLDDPARKPYPELVELDGTESRVSDFVFATDGAADLFWNMVRDIKGQRERGKDIAVLILCRGGRHRSVAFGQALASLFETTATHHHKHVPVVKKTVMLGHEGACCGHLVAHHQEIFGPRGGFGRGRCQIAECGCTGLVTA